jgi:transposase
LETFDVSGAGEPTTGESFFLALPYLTSLNWQMFLQEFSPGDQETRKIILLENSRCHPAKALVLPPHVVCLFLPPYRPELHPIARLWRDMKDRLAWVLVGPLAALAHPGERLITHSAKAAIRSLTSDPYCVAAVHAVCS